MTRAVNPRTEEALEMLIEECGEVIQAATKCLRHGMDSTSPFDEAQTPNYLNLAREIGDMRTLAWIVVCNHLPKGCEQVSCDTGRLMLDRWEKKKRWTHHQIPMTKEPPLRTADKFPEYKGLSAIQASTEAARLVDKAARDGRTMFDLVDRLQVLREIHWRKTEEGAQNGTLWRTSGRIQTPEKVEEARRLGLTLDQLSRKKIHDKRMTRGRELYLQQIRDQSDIDYFLQNK